MNDIQIFNNPQFGQVRTAGTSENPLFCLLDVCKALELRQGDVVRRLTDGVVSTQPIFSTLPTRIPLRWVGQTLCCPIHPHSDIPVIT